MKNNEIGLGTLLVEFIGRYMRNLVSLAVLLCLAGVYHPLCAQNTGTIFGNIVNQTNAVINHASVTVRNADNGLTRTVDSGASGEFQVPGLPVGSYELTASASSSSPQ